MECFKEWVLIIQSIITSLAIIIGGYWAILKFILFKEKFSHIEFFADINIIGAHDDWIIVELIGEIKNNGKAQHTINKIDFKLDSINEKDEINLNSMFRSQVDFPNVICENSFKPDNIKCFFIDPSSKTKYSHVTRVPNYTKFLQLHTWFEYTDREKSGHTAEKTIQINLSSSS